MKEAKAQSEENRLALNEARSLVVYEKNTKEVAQIEVNRLSEELVKTGKILKNEKELNKKLKYKIDILNNLLFHSQKNIGK